MNVEVTFTLCSMKIDFDTREVHSYGKVRVGKREIGLHKVSKMLHDQWKNLEEIGIRSLTDAVNESEKK